MSNQQQKPAAAASQLPAVKVDASVVEYVPYGSQDKIKLSIGIVQKFIAVPTKTNQTCSDRDAIKFIAMCQAKHLNPFEGDAFLIGYDGKDGPTFSLITAHQTYLKRAELHPEFDGMKSGVIVEQDGVLKELEGDFYSPGQRVVGGWATVFFKNRKQPMHKRLRVERFKKPFGIWQEDPAGMICKCAEADALRSAFPTMLGGLYLREEVEIMAPPPMSKPDFSTPRPLFATSTEALPDPEPRREPDTEMPPPREPDPNDAPPGAEMPPVEPPKTNGFNPLKAVRGLCKMSAIGEGKLLDYLAASGSTQGDVGSLEELAVQCPEVIRAVSEEWPDVSAKIKALEKGGGK